MNAWPKICKLCKRIIYAGEWSELSFCGYQLFDDERLELRNCECGTTLAVHVEPTGLAHTIVRDLAELFRIEANAREGSAANEDMAEADRLHEIADDLDARVQRAVYGASSEPTHGEAA